MDAIIQFNPLDNKTISNVVDKFLIELQAQLDEKKVSMEVDDSARKWLGEHGYDKIMGARPMQRLIQDKIKKPLAEDILFGKLAHGGHVIVSTDASDISLEILEKEAETGESA